MSRLTGLFVLLLASLVLAGCSHNVHRANAEAAYYQAQAATAAERTPIVELVARPGEQITLSGVERFAVYAPAADNQHQVRQYQGGPTFGETLRGIVRDAGPIFLGYRGLKTIAELGAAGIAGAGGNTTVGGNLGDTHIDRSRTQIDDRSLSAGGDLRIGDETNVGRIGDDLRDSCIGDSCRTRSPGPIDDSSNSNNPITSPPPEPTDPGGG